MPIGFPFLSEVISIKKAYSLDYSINDRPSRLAAVKTILDDLPITPNEDDLEQLADYILYGRDEKNLNDIDTHDITKPPRRYNTYRTTDDKVISLDALLDGVNPDRSPNAPDILSSRDWVETTAHIIGQKRDKVPYRRYTPTIKHPVYGDDGTLLERGDDTDNFGDEIPFMRDLWERIKHYQKREDMYLGKIPPDEYVRSHPLTNYNLYRFRHNFIDLKRQQFYIKDVYNPDLKFNKMEHPKVGEINYESDSGIWLTKEEWERRAANPKTYDMWQGSKTITDKIPYDAAINKYFWCISYNALDYEKPYHMKVLLRNYAGLLKKSYPFPDSSLRMICWDIEHLIEESHLDDLEHFLLRCLVANYNMVQIQKVLIKEGFVFADNEVLEKMSRKLPAKLAATARRLRIESEAETWDGPRQTCQKCGKSLPATPVYFYRDKKKKKGLSALCKECTRKQNRERGK